MSDQKKQNEKDALKEELDRLKLTQAQREFIESMRNDSKDVEEKDD